MQTALCDSPAAAPARDCVGQWLLHKPLEPEIRCGLPTTPPAAPRQISYAAAAEAGRGTPRASDFEGPDRACRIRTSALVYATATPRSGCVIRGGGQSVHAFRWRRR